MGQDHLSKPERKYKHLTYRERIRIEVMHRQGVKPKPIGAAIGCSQRTVERELKRGAVTQLDGRTWIYYAGYSAEAGQNRYRETSQGKGPALKIGHDHALCAHLETEIIEGKRSPDVALGRIKALGLKFQTSISTKTLYRYIDQGLFQRLTNAHLIYGKRARKPKRAAARPSYRNLSGRGIEERGKAANDRSEAGHWEMDCVVGGQGQGSAALLTLTERRTRAERIVKLEQKTQAAVIAALDRLERNLGARQFRDTFRSITMDNGCEFLDYAGIERSAVSAGKARTSAFYAHPYSAWERGSNENLNRMIRRFIPKGTNIGKLSKREIQRIEDWLNNYPRKILGYLTPCEAYALTA